LFVTAAAVLGAEWRTIDDDGKSQTSTRSDVARNR
jgi:hypothetical protein